MRPQYPWEDVVRVLNQADGARWTTERLRRAVRRAVRERLADAKLLERTPRRPPEDRLMMMAAGIAMANPEMSLRAIGAQLEAMRERTPRGGRQWAASSVKNLLDQAEKLGLAPIDRQPVSRQSHQGGGPLNHCCQPPTLPQLSAASRRRSVKSPLECDRRSDDDQPFLERSVPCPTVSSASRGPALM